MADSKSRAHKLLIIGFLSKDKTCVYSILAFKNTFQTYIFTGKLFILTRESYFQPLINYI